MTFRVLSIAVLLLGSVAATRLPLQTPTAKDLYDDNCMKCHGVRGLPPKTMKAKFPKIATFNAELMAKVSDDSIVKVLTKGKNEDMVSFKDKLTHEQMELVAKYVRGLAK